MANSNITVFPAPVGAQTTSDLSEYKACSNNDQIIENQKQ